MHEAHFVLHDVVIRAHAASMELLMLVSSTLSYKGAERVDPPPAHPAIELEIAQRRPIPEVPRGAARVGSFGRDIGIYLHDDMFFACSEDVYAVVIPARERAAVMLTPTTGPEDTFFTIAFALSALLRGRNLFGLHAGALAYEEHGLLLVGSSDTGKSTTTLALVRQGWSYVTDDAVLLDPRHRPLLARSFRRDFCVDPAAADDFPELAHHAWPPSLSDPTKWRVDVNQLYPGRCHSSTVPVVVVFPCVSDTSQTQLHPVPPMQAFEHLMAHSALLATPLHAWVDAQVQVLTRLLTQTRCYQMEAGRDVLVEPGQVSALLQSALLGTS